MKKIKCTRYILQPKTLKAKRVQVLTKDAILPIHLIINQINQFVYCQIYRERDNFEIISRYVISFKVSRIQRDSSMFLSQ